MKRKKTTCRKKLKKHNIRKSIQRKQNKKNRGSCLPLQRKRKSRRKRIYSTFYDVNLEINLFLYLWYIRRCKVEIRKNRIVGVCQIRFVINIFMTGITNNHHVCIVDMKLLLNWKKIIIFNIDSIT